ncbi:hypothetical protein A2165_03890 [Candidatus Curtissbacteria bacterium RBG_13_40_7]|uniref:Major facilitator superfamily (MFS) profile domain-containing protein n=1 Tax=Candidatus Curtissbacteria bacterium RBG_13_40_7 TaxID=1797706 RepID=A0A1F5FTT8_9BACT|nr:MAG: hypothetical protein A2165_03890 [Candidatus Curtissbacteria bacterium RBG_13_40_7]
MGRKFLDLLVLHFLNDGVRTTFIVILPFIAKDLALNFKMVSVLGSAQPLIASILALPAGFFASRFGAFQTLITVLLVYSLGSLLVGISPNVFIMLIAFFLGAIGFGMFHTISFALVAKISEKSNVGTNLGSFTAIGDIGRVAVPPVAVFATAQLGWRPTMISIAAIGLAIFFGVRFFQKFQNKIEVKDNKLITENYLKFFKESLKLFSFKKIRLIILAGVIDAAGSSPIYIFLPFLLLLKNITPQQLSLLIGAFFAGSFAGKVILGKSVDQFGNKKVFIASEISMAILIIFIATSNPILLLLALSFMLGIFTKGTSPVVQSMFSHLVEKEHYNKIYALGELLIGAGAMLSIITMGFVSDRFGVKSVFFISSVTVIIATLPLILIDKLDLQIKLSYQS